MLVLLYSTVHRHKVNNPVLVLREDYSLRAVFPSLVPKRISVDVSVREGRKIETKRAPKIMRMFFMSILLNWLI